MSEAKLSRLESGQLPVKKVDVLALCDLYDVDDQIRDHLANLAAGTEAGVGWWEEFSDTAPHWFRLYLDLEHDADEIVFYEPLLVHGLFQTADYATAVYRAAQPDTDETRTARHVRLRMRRQQAVLDRQPSARLRLVLDEGVLARPVGGQEVMSAQVAHLRGVNQLPHIVVEVLPFEIGAHAAMLGSFALLDFADTSDPSVVYVESEAGAHYLETNEQVARYRRVVALLDEQVVPLEEWHSDDQGYTVG
jgi:hypothetical protein